MYAKLRDELAKDELLAGQPKAAEEWLKEVRAIVRAAGSAPVKAPSAHM